MRWKLIMKIFTWRQQTGDQRLSMNYNQLVNWAVQKNRERKRHFLICKLPLCMHVFICVHIHLKFSVRRNKHSLLFYYSFLCEDGIIIIQNIYIHQNMRARWSFWKLDLSGATNWPVGERGRGGEGERGKQIAAAPLLYECVHVETKWYRFITDITNKTGKLKMILNLIIAHFIMRFVIAY